MFTKAYIPYGGYYCSPFAKWQGSLSNENSIVLGAATAKRWIESKGWETPVFDYTYHGITVVQKSCFYGSTWANAMMDHQVPGMTIIQACSTSTTCIHAAALAVETGTQTTPFCFLADRMSNAPHLIWPNPKGPGGEVIAENWNMDNINADPSTGQGMLNTAENVAKLVNATREETDDLAVMRYEQYLDALKDDRAFQKRYMFPVEVKINRKKTITLDADEGVTPVTKDGIAHLKPVMPGGIHTFASQTHPADGNAGIIVTTKERAANLSSDRYRTIQIISYGFAREGKALMPAAPVPAAQMALDRAGITIKDVKVIKTHNPFAANDLYFAKKFGIDLRTMDNYGCSMIFGHPQAPTVARLVIEGIEEAIIRGGGYVLIAGCAAGDTGAALVLRVD
ncbi:thiolase family protein [Desulfopila aestuarii]